jgi:hypothetical protein
MIPSRFLLLVTLITGLFLTLSLSGCSGGQDSNTARPNILLILSDQQHYQCLWSAGQELRHTQYR